MRGKTDTKVRTYRQAVFIFMLSMFTFISNAQDCDFQKLLLEGKTCYKNGDFRAALNKYNAAKTCDFSKGIEVDKEMNKVFLAIENQRDDAVEAKKMAENNANLAIASELKAQEQAIIAEKLRVEAEHNLRKAQSLIKVFHSRDTLAIDGTKSLLLAFESVKFDTTKESYASLMDAFQNIHYTKEINSNLAIKKIALSPNGNQIAIGFENGSIQICNLEFDSCKTISGHSGSITALIYSSDGKRLISTSEDRKIKVWSSADGSFMHAISGPATIYKGFVVLNNDTLVAGSIDGKIRFWDINSNKAIKEKEFNIAGFYEIKQLASSYNYGHLGILSSEGVVLLNDRMDVLFRKNSPFISSIEFSPNGDLFTFSTEKGEIYLYSIAKNTTTNISTGKNIIFTKFISDTELVLTFNANKMAILNINDLGENKKLHEWNAHTTIVNEIVLSRQSNAPEYFFSFTNNQIHIWNIVNARSIARLKSVGDFKFSDFDVYELKDTISLLRKSDQSIIPFSVREPRKTTKRFGGLNQSDFIYRYGNVEFIAKMATTIFGHVDNISVTMSVDGNVFYNKQISESDYYLDNAYISANGKFFLIKLKDNSVATEYRLFYTPIYIAEYISAIKTINLKK